MLVIFQYLITVLYVLIKRTISDLPKSQQIVFPREVQLFTAMPFYSPQASFFQIRHMNHSICSLDATGNAIFPCRCFGFPSGYYELLIDNIPTLKFSVTVRKKFWKIPENPIICQPLIIEFDFNVLCSELNLSLHLQYTSSAMNNKKTDKLKLKTVVEMPLEKKMIIPCHHLCFPGIYQIVVMNGGWIVQIIKTVKLKQANEISISLRRPYIFPRCIDYLKITWTNLSCPVPNLEFKMRVFAVPEGSSFERSYYVEEYDIELSQQAIELPCYQFDIIHAQFCFEIVSVQKLTARFNDWARKCVYTENLGQIEGSWREWSTWSMCSASCGHGLQRRWRLCDSPAPKNGGNLCEGNFIEYLECYADNCTKSAAIATAESDTPCYCGCLLSYTAGRFFARTCEKITNWMLKSHGRFLELKLKPLNIDSIIGYFRLAIYRGLKKEELVYDYRGKSHGRIRTLRFISEDYFVISLIKTNGPLNTNSGVEINFEWKNSSNEIVPPTATLELSHFSIFCHLNMSLLLSTLLIILIISFPPLLCSYVTKLTIRRTKWKQNRQLRIDNSLDEPRPDPSMIQSGQTEVTEIKSNRNVITKRSIGIQLSASSTPRFPRDRRILWSRATNSPQMTLRYDEHSSLSYNTDHDLEYDYYEPTVPGSFLTPAVNFYSDIDIEQIIGGSELSYSLISKHDAHTQIENI